MVKSIIAKVDGIFDEVERFSDCNELGLLNGDFGILYFQSLLCVYKPRKKYFKAFQKRMDKTLDRLNGSSSLDFTFGYGLTGFGWLLKHLIRMDVVDRRGEVFRYLSYIDDHITKESELSGLDYENFTGLIGYGNYLLQSYDVSTGKSLLERIVSRIIGSSSSDGNGRFWVDQPGNIDIDNVRVNLGLAHGQPSIISFLLRVYDLGLTGVTQKLICEGIDWMLKYSIKVDNYRSFPYFVNTIDEKTTPDAMPGRLAWCYGDLGVSSTLLFAGRKLKQKEYFDEGVFLARHTAQRLYNEESGIKDASICHGSAGVAYVFNHLYRYTGEHEFKHAAKYWYGTTLSMLSDIDGVAGYKYFSDYHNGTLKSESGLLVGAAGVGVSLLHALPSLKNEKSFAEVLLLPI